VTIIGRDLNSVAEPRINLTVVVSRFDDDMNVTSLNSYNNTEVITIQLSRSNIIHIIHICLAGIMLSKFSHSVYFFPVSNNHNVFTVQPIHKADQPGFSRYATKNIRPTASNRQYCKLHNIHNC